MSMAMGMRGASLEVIVLGLVLWRRAFFYIQLYRFDLFLLLEILPDDIWQTLMVVVWCCMKRDNLAAMDQYIKMAIGNAPWPIGIHERSAREKIYTNSVAHIMNDETTRKYLQSVKRLLTFCQRRYPAAPSKSVEFNSLANGSDLHSLLSEERVGGRTSEDRLRLMPASKD